MLGGIITNMQGPIVSWCDTCTLLKSEVVKQW